MPVHVRSNAQSGIACSPLSGTLAVLTASIILTVASTAALAQTKAFSLGLWGDMPYAKAKDEPKIPALIADMNILPASRAAAAS